MAATHWPMSAANYQANLRNGTLPLRIQAELNHVGGALQRAQLVERLLPYALGRGIVDDASSRLRVQHTVLDDRASQRDRRIHIVLKADVTHRAGINTTPRRLELIDDFHRAHLRRAAHRSRWERC